MQTDLDASKKGQTPGSSVLHVKPQPIQPPKPPVSSVPRPAPVLPKLTTLIPAPLAPAPITPSAPAPAPAPNPSIIVPPPQQTSSKGKSLLYLALGLVLAGALAFWYFALRGPSEVAVSTPTPTPTEIPTSTPTPLPSLAERFNAAAYTLLETKPTLDFNSVKQGKSVLPALAFDQPVYLKVLASSSTEIDFASFLAEFGITAPQGLAEALNPNDWLVFYHGQKESFSAAGKPLENTVPESRIGFIAKTESSFSLRSVLNVWESTMVNDLAKVLNYTPSKNKTPVFSDAQYKGTTVRYVNFPYPNSSLDYAIVSGSDASNYLVISNSRESIFKIIDILTDL